MSNKKFAKRIKKNQSNNYPTTKTWKNEDGSMTIAIPVPMFIIDTNIRDLLFNMCDLLHRFLVKENIPNITPEEWDKLTDNHEFCNKVFIRWYNDYARICVKHLKLDMYEYAPKFVSAVNNLIELESKWMDIVTQQTGLQSVQLPILESWARFINNHIEEIGEDLYNHWKQFAA